ncbi:hypothetical protein LCGC14_2893100, partial [marine sediment metagenome]
MSIAAIVSITVFVGLLFVLFQQQQKTHTLSRLVLLGLVSGSVFGLALQLVFSEGHAVVKETLSWIDIIGSGYIGLLKMVIMPLVLVSMIAAVVKLDKDGSLGKISSLTIAILLVTTAIAALIGIMVVQVFG